MDKAHTCITRTFMINSCQMTRLILNIVILLPLSGL